MYSSARQDLGNAAIKLGQADTAAASQVGKALVAVGLGGEIDVYG